MDFSIELGRQALLNQEKEGFIKNFACSPLSINVFLNMIASGSSKGSSLERFLFDLGFTNVEDLINKSSQLLALANKNDDKDDGRPIVCLPNGVWVHHLYNLKSSFQQILQNVFKFEPKSHDFHNKEQLAEEVNSWVKDATKGLINDIIQSSDIDCAMQMILVNALYFKGVWMAPFDESNTKERDFHLLNGKTIKVPFMHNYGEYYSYGSFEGFKAIKLPYQKGKDDQRTFTMYFILPDKRDGLHDLIQRFSSNPGFINQYFALGSTKIDKLMIPKFKFTIDFRLACGLNTGELLEKVDSPNEKVIGSTAIYQKCYVEIDEEGTKAAAVTYGLAFGSGMNMNKKPPINFIVDHPFIFMIKEETSNVPFFFGTVINPLLEK